VIFSVGYRLARCLLSWLMQLARREASKDAELLVVRHEALSVPNGGGRRPSSPCRRSGGVKLEAASPRVGGDGGSSLDKVASFQHCRMGRAR